VCTTMKVLHESYVRCQPCHGNSSHATPFHAAQGQLSAGRSAGAADSAASVNMLKAWQACAFMALRQAVFAKDMHHCAF
jgi:hypothetical protein